LPWGPGNPKTQYDNSSAENVESRRRGNKKVWCRGVIVDGLGWREGKLDSRLPKGIFVGARSPRDLEKGRTKGRAEHAGTANSLKRKLFIRLIRGMSWIVKGRIFDMRAREKPLSV